MSPNIPHNVAKHSGESPQQFNVYFFAYASPFYTFFTGNKETNNQNCPELSVTWFEISYSRNHFCRLGNSIENMKINLSRGNDI